MAIWCTIRILQFQECFHDVATNAMRLNRTNLWLTQIHSQKFTVSAEWRCHGEQRRREKKNRQMGIFHFERFSFARTIFANSLQSWQRPQTACIHTSVTQALNNHESIYNFYATCRPFLLSCWAMLVMCVRAFDVRAMSTSSLNDTKSKILPSSSARVEEYSETVFRLIRPIVVWILRGCARHAMPEFSEGNFPCRKAKWAVRTTHAMVIC